MTDYAFLRFPEFRDKAVTLSYDDGVVYDERLMRILDAHGLKCTFNLNSGLFAKKTNAWRFSAEHAVALYANSGHEVAAHGMQHLCLTPMTNSAIAFEILEDRRNLEALFDRQVIGMAYANGSYDDRVVDVLKACGVKYARTVICTGRFDIPTDWLRMPTTCRHADPNLMRLADEFLEEYTDPIRYWKQPPKLFYLWGHSYEFNDDDNWEVIEKFAEKVGDRADVWYATNGEIYDYVQAYEALRYSADGKRIYNPTATDLWLRPYGQCVKVPAGATVQLQ